jgi:predicted transcriptional regulator
MDAREGIRFLAGSDGRIAVLRELSEAPCRPCELREQTAASRTAIHRALSGFEEYGWVRKQEERYSLTAAGRHVFEQYEELATAVAQGDRFSEFFTAFPLADDLPVLFDGDVCVSTPIEPQAAETFFFDRLPADADRLRGFSPVLTQRMVDSFEPTVESGTTVELVYDKPFARHIQETYPEMIELAVESENVTIHVVGESIEFGLALVDGEVFLKAYGSHGDLYACLHSTDEQLLDWANDWFDRISTDSVPLARYVEGVDLPG